jgi:hypothetical protein
LASTRQVDHAVTRDLVQHVVEEADAGGELGRARAVEVEDDADLRFQGVACDVGLPHGSLDQAKGRGLHDTIGLAACTSRPNPDHHCLPTIPPDHEPFLERCRQGPQALRAG